MQSWIPFVPKRFHFLEEGRCALFLSVGRHALFTLLISEVLIFFVIRYRRRTPYEIPRPVAGSHKLETIWSVIPFVIAMTMFAWGAQVYFRPVQVRTAERDRGLCRRQAVDVENAALDRAARDQRTARAGRTEDQVDHDSEDVIHDFFVPAFRIKADVRSRPLHHAVVRSDKAGPYHLFCAEYCGMNHSGMIGSVVVMEPTRV